MSDPIIKINNMNKWFGDFQVLKDINLEVEANKKIVVCGMLQNQLMFIFIAQDKLLKVC